MKIEKNKVVALSYDLHSSKGESNERTHVESTGDIHPLVFLFGTGNMIPEFEKNLEGKSAGDVFEFSILSGNAYGENDPKALINLPVEIFKKDGVLDLKLLQTGNIVPLMDTDGNRMNGKVVKLEGDNVLMDFNHPLAGKNLHFKGKIVEVREATAEELSHGHVHTGHGGH
ncbi:MAG: FKBP-type peptidyl-prolyl cis-trans isomerase [Bacteroidota bacterium]